MDRVAHEGSNAVRRALMKHRALARTASGQRCVQKYRSGWVELRTSHGREPGS